MPSAPLERCCLRVSSRLYAFDFMIIINCYIHTLSAVVAARRRQTVRLNLNSQAAAIRPKIRISESAVQNGHR
jgi:hypothetical protein